MVEYLYLIPQLSDSDFTFFIIDQKYTNGGMVMMY